jgi:hypothetical protein
VIGFGRPEAVEPSQPAAPDVPSGPSLGDGPDVERPRRRTIWFDDPDGAYLADAALRRYLEATVVRDVILVRTERGPGLEIPADAARLGVVRALVVRFGGHIGPEE